jgi:hypothetical protein
MKLTSGENNNNILMISKKKPTEIKENIKIPKPKRNLNNDSI